VKVILTHENSDFDALASQLAAYKLFAGAIPVLSRRLNREVRAFVETYGAQLPFVSVNDVPRKHVEEAIFVDAQAVSAVKGMDNSTSVSVIDHHALHGEPKRGVQYTIDEVGATTTLLAEKLSQLRTSLTPLEATLLLLGIYEDTGSLSYPTTTPRDLRCAAWLLEQEASLEVVGEYLRHPLDERYQSVYGQLIKSVEWRNIREQAILVASAELSEYLDDLSTLAHKLDDVFDPDASFMLFAFKDQIQLIARSGTPAVDVGQMARTFGGGGHRSAAAALIPGSSMEDVRGRLGEVLNTLVRPPVTVREIMSFGVHTLHPELRLSDAEALMRRYGHEGFPVVDDGTLLGVLTRREIDRALHHGLEDATVRSFMHTGNVAVSPSDSVSTVQAVMTEQGVGQVPVVENGRVLGIVTRTDLIKLWSTPDRPSRRQEIRRRLRENLPAPLLDILEDARDAANRMGYSLYLVGGFVRDLLLEKPTLDLDLVVEGDAIALAEELATQLGGRVRSHDRFGVAKVILGGTAGTNLPPWLDLTTARTEFYEHPTALPEVERSSIKQDLYRRDFTINTMAVCLDRDRYGELLDFYGGERDLREALVRVLHNLSFVEDPTRILRAVRLEQRLEFAIESRTTELIEDALGLLDRVSGERLRHELEMILDEGNPGGILARLQELGVLRRLEPALTIDDWLIEKLRSAEELLASSPPDLLSKSAELGTHRRGADPGERRRELLLAMLTYRLTRPHLERFVERLRFKQRIVKLLSEIRTLRSRWRRLDSPNLTPSRVYQLLQPFSALAIVAVSIATDSDTVRSNIRLYLEKLRYVRLHVSGGFLKAEGVPPGPVYTSILDDLLYARLDGLVQTVAEEEQRARDAIAEWRSRQS